MARAPHAYRWQDNKMKILTIILAVIFITVGNCHAGYDIEKLAKAVNPIYPVWKVNNRKTKEEYGFQLLFKSKHPMEIEIPNFKEVLGGPNNTLIACYGRIIPSARNGYVVGSGVFGPTSGEIIIFDDNFQKLAEIDSQRVVKIKLANLLGEDTLQIIIWEDEHYGTNTTRRVLNIYRIDASKGITRIFSHDIVDATFMPADHEIHYKVDYQSQIKKKQIIITNEDTRDKVVCSWNGETYKGKDCQQQNQGDGE